NQTLLSKTVHNGQSTPISRKDSSNYQKSISEQLINPMKLEKHNRFYHLVKPTDINHQREGKLVSEVYLTRLLATKGSLQQYIDNFFETIFRLSDLPTAVKYLFDFLDDQAQLRNITETHIIHTWKSNSLPLRFFVNIIKNPDFIFDVQKTNVIDASLSVIAQMFMDSCSAGSHELTKDSPSTKLLFNRDVQKYKKLVEKYYDSICQLPSVSLVDLNTIVKESTQQYHRQEFNSTYLLFRLYDEFISKYKENIRTAMENDLLAKQYRLSLLLEQIITTMETFELDV
ncbi:unnamed protein product, partial [Didymodactylos carnosus]